MRTFAALFLLFFIVSCTQAPQPYRHSRTGFDTSVLRLRDAGTVEIMPFEGVSAPIAQTLAKGLSESLGARQIAATVNVVANPAYRVRAQVVLQPENGDEADIGYIYWSFVDRANKTIRETSQQIKATHFQWDYGDEKVIETVVEDAADRFADFLQDKSEKEAVAQAVDEQDVVFKIGEIVGARGDGAVALKRAMGLTLRQYGARVRRIVRDNDYILNAEIDILPAFEGRQRIKVDWVLQTVDGKELGRVQLNNQMAAGHFDGAWGPMAHNISRAAIQGIGNLVERHRAELYFERSREVPATTAPPGRRKKDGLLPF